MKLKLTPIKKLSSRTYILYDNLYYKLRNKPFGELAKSSKTKVKSKISQSENIL